MSETLLLERKDIIRQLQVHYLQQLIRDEWHHPVLIKERLHQIKLKILTADHLRMQFVTSQLRMPQSSGFRGQERRDELMNSYQRLCQATAFSKSNIFPLSHRANPTMTSFLLVLQEGAVLERKTEWFVEELQQKFTHALKLDSVLGIGGEVTDLQSLKNGYASSMLAWSNQTVSTEGQENRKKRLDLSKAFPVESGWKLLQTIEASDSSNLRNQLEAIFYAENHSVPNLISLRILLLLSYITRKFESGGTSLQKYIWNCQMRLQEYPSREELVEMMQELALLVMEEVRKTCGSSVHHIEAIRKYVEENCSSDMSPSLLAELFHMNEFSLSDRFKQHVGGSLHKYVTKLRMTKAEQLLQQSAIKVKETAKLVGYSDVDYFTDCFKKHCGESPKKFRERYLHY